LPEPMELDLASQPAPARRIVSTIDPVLRNINVGKYLEAIQPPGTTR